MSSRTDESIRSVSRSHRTKTTKKTNFDGLYDIWTSLTELLEPPERVSVSEAAERHVRINNPGSYIGPYRRDLAPYMQEPMDTLASREFTGAVFCGPAQSGKTESTILCFVGYSVKIDPMDMAIFSPSMATARDFSMRRIDRLHRNSPDIGKMMLKTREADNKFDKHYKSGMILTLSWPTVNELAGKPIGRVCLTDYDRMDDDIGGDGNPFDLATKRTTTFKSFAMTLAESSPSRPVENAKWIKKTPHEAPPCKGILGLYNRGDRRRWYWPCPHCGSYFEARWNMLEWDTKANHLDSADTVRLIAPCCRKKVYWSDVPEMQEFGVWLKDGQSVNPETGRIVGTGVRSKIASWWMFGLAAAFTTWSQLVVTYLNAMSQFEKTGSEEELKKFFNTDLAEPYIPRASEVQRLPEVLKARAEALPYKEVTSAMRIDRPNTVGTAIEPLVPPGVRFIVACVDVQKNMFVVQMHGICPGDPYDVVVFDRFSIKKSQRQDAMGESLWVNPGSYIEDWSEVTSEVIQRSYELSDGTGRRMFVKFTVCDSGGHAKTTTNAYAYYRKLKEEGEAGRFHLVKGDPLASRPRAMITFPDSNQRDKLAAARGDVPVMLFNSNTLKDAVVNRLECVEPGKGMFRFPSWLPDWWFAEMCAENRTEKGWESPSHRRNEGFDLSYYCLGVNASALLMTEKLDWSNPPGWAAEWGSNFLVSKGADTGVFTRPPEVLYDFSTLGQALA